MQLQAWLKLLYLNIIAKESFSMKIIPAIKDTNGTVLGPSEPFPAITSLIRFDGENYIVYQDGDDLPQD
jgi:hypothetical protein